MFGFDDLAVATMAAPLIGGLFGIGTNKANAEQNEAQRQWQSRENELSRNFTQGENAASRSFTAYENQLSRDWQEKMWNAQNQYNTPSAMMARYKEAGLNPYLAGMSQIGQGAGSAGTPATSSSAPMSGSASMGSPGSPIPMQNPFPAANLMQAAGVSANIANQHADALLKVSQALPELGKSLGWDNARKVASQFLDLQGVRGSQAERLLDQQIGSYELQNQFQRIQNGIAAKYGDRKAGLECSNLEQTFSKITAEIGKMASDVKVNESTVKRNSAEIRKMASEFVRNHAEALKMAAETETLNQMREYVVSSARHQASMLYMDDQTRQAFYRGSSGVREYLNSGDGIETIRDAFILKAERDADEFWSLVLQLGHVNVGANFSSSSSSIERK